MHLLHICECMKRTRNLVRAWPNSFDDDAIAAPSVAATAITTVVIHENTFSRQLR